MEGAVQKRCDIAVCVDRIASDLALGVIYIRIAVIFGFMANELISITENAGLMGIPLPTVIQNAIEVLTRKASVSKDGEQ